MTVVSVIIPTYNRSGHIQHAIQSVLEQTYSDLEVVVVDDGSNDSTVQTVEEYTQKEPRVRLVVHSERKGAQAARNTGIQAARGEWIAFLDSDDKWLPDSLESRLSIAKKGLEIVHSECYVLKPEDGNLRQLGVPAVHGQVYKKLLQRAGPMFQALLVSKESLARISYLDEVIVAFQEWDTAIRLAKHYEFGFLPEPTFIYDCRNTDTISKDLLRTAVGYEQVVRKHRRSVLRYLGPKTLASHYQRAAALYQEANEKAQAHRCLLKAFLLWPFRANTIVRHVRLFWRQFNG
jgi:glycosyltransferase involved in cell wall biosynthesis